MGSNFVQKFFDKTFVPCKKRRLYVFYRCHYFKRQLFPSKNDNIRKIKSKKNIIMHQTEATFLKDQERLQNVTLLI